MKVGKERMRILHRGNRNDGFSTLDAVIALIIVTVTWAAIVPYLHSSMNTQIRLENELQTVLTQTSEREIQSWDNEGIEN